MPNRKKPPEKKQDHAIKASFTAAEYEAILERARSCGLLPAEYAHDAIVRKQVISIPAVNQQVWTQLARPLGNLSKITQLLYQAKYKGTTIPTRLLKLLEAELLELQQLRSALVGQTNEEIALETVNETVSNRPTNHPTNDEGLAA
ncbi:hypothetical protein K9N68_39130 (plasmid) [Kovacikia minuta CCNUW1]|uniref:plasmid mobilization protein n=1 Tax=Kovacikia minuta TaxID=2931930 RepID=UPI001CCB6C58|nr:hypothetical protein [Kovacikia minuta]UBF30158.1 hypothetical protein K9N68_39130 [Kovacikia minuta CCNUW1]